MYIVCINESIEANAECDTIRLHYNTEECSCAFNTDQNEQLSTPEKHCVHDTKFILTRRNGHESI